MSELLPCPFCGHNAEESEYTGCEGRVLLAACEDCGGEWPREFWNRRAMPPEVAKVVLAEEEK